jgi:imidazolonepropionase-like amidohydrolase
MRVVNLVALVALAVAAFGESPVPALAQAPTATAYEGARLIVGDGRAPIENATVVVDGGRIIQAGAAADVRVPPGAARVNLAGETVMPMLIDTHNHLSQTTEGLTRDLKQRAYYGVSASMSMGTAETTAELEMRGKTEPGMARLFTAWRGITRPEPGRTMGPIWIDTEADGRKAVQDLVAHKVDIIKLWVDDRDGKYPKLTPPLYSAVIDEAHKNGFRTTAHIYTLEDAKGVLRAGIDAFAIEEVAAVDPAMHVLVQQVQKLLWEIRCLFPLHMTLLSTRPMPLGNRFAGIWVWRIPPAGRLSPH